jgi:superfamily I DNA/RNA helicase
MGNARRFPIKGVDGMRQRNFLAFIEDLSNLSKSTKEMTLHKKLLYILENSKTIIKTEDSERKDILNNIIGITKTFGNNTSKFLTSVALQTDTDIYDSQAEKVILMTMHAAKGLEFPIIFITGCENGYLPFEKSDKGRNDINEERRLFYVAMTRAKKRLYLTYAKKRRIYGKVVLREISPFVKDIENRLKKQEIQFVEKKKKENQVQLKLF